MYKYLYTLSLFERGFISLSNKDSAHFVNNYEVHLIDHYLLLRSQNISIFYF